MPSSSLSGGESSSGEESSHYDSDASIDLEQNGSRKRRKLSPASDSETEPTPRSIPTATLSRVKAKKTGLLLNDSGNQDSVASVLSGKERMSFADLSVSPWLVQSLAAMAITRPTGIQKGCISEILKGRDCIGGSRTGSGKTIAFAVPILQKWAEDPVGIFAVILTPTRYV